LAETVTSAGALIVGGWGSSTVTVNVQMLVFPLASFATFVTVVTPTGNVLPLGGMLTWPATPTLSDALTVKVTLLRLLWPGSAANTWFDGQVITGGSASRTVTVKVEVLLLPLASVAVFVTVVTPTGNVLPLGGQLTRPAKVQLSVALTVKVTLLRLRCPESAIRTRLLGHIMVGALVSRTITRCTQLLVLPLVSVTVQVTKLVPKPKVAGTALTSDCTR
jgi:hypothetical protein